MKEDTGLLLVILGVMFPPAGILMFLWWLITGARQSPIKRGILAALLAWTVMGVVPIHQSDEDQNKLNALSQACEDADLPRVRTLLLQGVDPNGQIEFTSPLALAVASDPKNSNEIKARVAVVRTLILEGADIRKQFPEMVQRSNAAMVKALLDSGIDPNAVSTPCENTALVAAVRCEDVEKVKVLIKAGADVNGHSVWYGTPLHILHARLGHENDKRASQAIGRVLRQAGATD